MIFQSAAIAKNKSRQQQATTKSIPAPVGGWNDRDSLSSMDEEDAVILDNFFPLPSKVIIRKGTTSWSTGLGNQVESLMGYRPQSGTAALFGAAGTSFFNVTANGAVGAAVVTGLTNSRWQHINVATSGGNFLMAVNGSDKLRGWDGLAWWTDGDGAHDITGVDTATCIDIALFKRRTWLIKKNSSSAYYGPVDGIAGAFTQLDFGPIFERGGTLTTMVGWSLDAGIGIDDYAAFISNQGEVALYKGSDPSSATTWALVGVFLVGSPVGFRCTAQFAGDVLLIGKDGLVPLSKALQTSRLNTSVELTDKIQNTVSTSTTAYASNFGWQVIPFPGENMIVLNVPVGTGQQQQYVMNTISGSWCRFKGWAANCFELFGDDLYYGGNGVVYKAWQGQNDAGVNINAEALQAFNYFGNRSMMKEWTLARPLISIDNNTGFVFGINTDFDMSPPVGVPTFTATSAGQWDVALWDVGIWGGDPSVQKQWQSVNGVGQCAAIHIVAATNVGRIEWSATDYAYKPGGIL